MLFFLFFWVSFFSLPFLPSSPPPLSLLLLKKKKLLLQQLLLLLILLLQGYVLWVALFAHFFVGFCFWLVWGELAWSDQIVEATQSQWRWWMVPYLLPPSSFLHSNACLCLCLCLLGFAKAAAAAAVLFFPKWVHLLVHYRHLLVHCLHQILQQQQQQQLFH